MVFDKGEMTPLGQEMPCFVAEMASQCEAMTARAESMAGVWSAMKKIHEAMACGEAAIEFKGKEIALSYEEITDVGAAIEFNRNEIFLSYEATTCVGDAKDLNCVALALNNTVTTCFGTATGNNTNALSFGFNPIHRYFRSSIFVSQKARLAAP